MYFVDHYLLYFRKYAILQFSTVLGRSVESLQCTRREHILTFIPSEQFGFLKGSGTSDAGISLASTITSVINQQAEVKLVAF